MSLQGLGVLQVEPTDHCNLQCKMCAPHRDGWSEIHGVSKGYLDLELWKKIVDDFVLNQLCFDHIIFQWLGDPLMHSGLHEIVSYASLHLKEQVNYLRIDTNAILLDPIRSQAIAEAASKGTPVLLVFSLDANSSKIYQKVKGRDHFDLVRRNIRRLLRIRRLLGPACQLNFQMQFVVQKENAHETLDFLRYWTDLLSCQGGQWHDEVMFKRLSVDGGDIGQAAADAVYERSVFGAGITPGENRGVEVMVWQERPWQNDDAHHAPRSACPGLWMTPVIRHDGRLMMCCADLKGELQLGSLSKENFSSLWFGARAQGIRKAHNKGQFEGACATCGGVNWYKLTEAYQTRFNKEASRFQNRKIVPPES